MSAFKEIFSRDENENKKDKYDLKWLQHDKDSGLLATTLENYIENEKKHRAGGRAQKVVTLDSVEKDVDDSLDSVMD